MTTAPKQFVPGELELRDDGRLVDPDDSEVYGHVPVSLRPLYDAAPDLLKACQDVLKWIDAGCDPSRGSIERMRAAVAKAT